MKTAYEYNKELIQKAVPSMAYDGSDIALWQGKAREKLRELLGMDRFERVDPQPEIEFDRTENGVREIRLTFRSEAGYRVPIHILLPEGVERPPVLIGLQGHSKGMHISLGHPKYPGDEKAISEGDRDFCVRAVQEGYAAIALEQRNFGECGGDENGPRCLESAMTALLMGRTTIGERVWDVCRLIDLLEQDFAHQLDLSRIILMGNSGGGTATAYTAALEDRITLAMPSCAMCTYKDSIGAMYHCTCNYVPHIAEYFDMGDLLAMAWPKYYVQVSGVEDSIFPISGAEEVFAKGKMAYESRGQGDRCALVRGAGGHRFYADDAWPVVHGYLDKTDI